MFRVCRVFVCVRHGSSWAEKGTSVSPWSAAARLLAAGAVNDPSIGPELVRILLAALPLQEDFEEAAAVGPNPKP